MVWENLPIQIHTQILLDINGYFDFSQFYGYSTAKFKFDILLLV